MTEQKPTKLSENSTIVSKESLLSLLTYTVNDHIIGISAGNTPNVLMKKTLECDQHIAFIRLGKGSDILRNFNEQIAAAASTWCRLVNDQPESDEDILMDYIRQIYANPPHEMTLLVFESFQLLKDGFVKKAIIQIFMNPPENITVILLTPSEKLTALKLNLVQLNELEDIQRYIDNCQFDELVEFFARRRLQQCSPAMVEEYSNILCSIPKHHLEAHPMLEVVKAGIHFSQGQFREASRILHNAEALCSMNAPVNDSKSVLGEIHLMRALIQMHHGNVKFVEWMHSASELMPDGSALINRNSSLYLCNRFAAAWCGLHEVDVKRMLSAMFEAAPSAQKLMHGFGSGSEYLASAEIHYFTDHIQSAKKDALRSVRLAEEHAQWDIACRAHLYLMQAEWAQGNYQSCMFHLKRAKEFRMRYEAEERVLLLSTELSEIKFFLRIGEGWRTASWLLDESARKDYYFYLSDETPICFIACLADRKRYMEALTASDEALQQYGTQKQFICLVSIYILKALIHDSIGEFSEALACFQLAYEIANSLGTTMLFIEYGKRMVDLTAKIQDSQNHSIPASWLEHIKARAGTFARYTARIRKQYLLNQKDDSPLNHLTKREREMVALLCEGLSNQEIASRLNIQQGSVKTSLSRIYTKINAENRVDAVRMILSKESVI